MPWLYQVGFTRVTEIWDFWPQATKSQEWKYTSYSLCFDNASVSPISLILVISWMTFPYESRELHTAQALKATEN